MIHKNTEDPIERMALESWEKAKDKLNNGMVNVITEEDFKAKMDAELEANGKALKSWPEVFKEENPHLANKKCFEIGGQPGVYYTADEIWEKFMRENFLEYNNL